MWLDTDLSTLKSAIADRRSAGETSRMLLGKFSRSACLAKAHRLGLQFASVPQPSAIGFSPLTGLIRTVRQIAPVDAAPPTQREDQAARDAANPGMAYMLLAFGDCKCRWPLNDHADIEEHRICGQVALDGRSYCSEHFAVAFRPMRPREISHVGKVRGG